MDGQRAPKTALKNDTKNGAYKRHKKTALNQGTDKERLKTTQKKRRLTQNASKNFG